LRIPAEERSGSRIVRIDDARAPSPACLITGAAPRILANADFRFSTLLKNSIPPVYSISNVTVGVRDVGLGDGAAAAVGWSNLLRRLVAAIG
jgi:hypothetical protein